MVSPRETEMLAEARLDEWRVVILPTALRREAIERQLAGPATRMRRSFWRSVLARLVKQPAGAESRGRTVPPINA